jgi:hypothetical protein
MIKRGDDPEEATEEPRILTPAEEGERAWRRLDLDAETGGRRAHRFADADNPLRTPGELSPKRQPAEPRPKPEDDED